MMTKTFMADTVMTVYALASLRTIYQGNYYTELLQSDLCFDVAEFSCYALMLHGHRITRNFTLSLQKSRISQLSQLGDSYNSYLQAILEERCDEVQLLKIRPEGISMLQKSSLFYSEFPKKSLHYTHYILLMLLMHVPLFRFLYQ